MYWRKNIENPNVHWRICVGLSFKAHALWIMHSKLLHVTPDDIWPIFINDYIVIWLIGLENWRRKKLNSNWPDNWYGYETISEHCWKFEEKCVLPKWWQWNWDANESYFGPNVLKDELISSWQYLRSIDFSLIGHNIWKVILIHHCTVLGVGLQLSTWSHQMNYSYSQLVVASFSE